MPEGWSYKSIGSLLEHEIGGGWGKDEKLQEFSEAAYVIRDTDFNSAGVARTVLINNELLDQFNSDAMCASFCKLVRTENIDNSYSLFYFFQYLREIKATEVFEIRSASNIVNYNWTAFLKFQQMPMPNKSILKKFNQILEPLHKQLFQLGKQNQLLKEARDILLPRLMTGMIDVDKITVPNSTTDKTQTSSI